jgi:hypothetical protein
MELRAITASVTVDKTEYNHKKRGYSKPAACEDFLYHLLMRFIKVDCHNTWPSKYIHEICSYWQLNSVLF